jgi:dihydrofolate reductase
MGNVVAGFSTSLDGFIAGPNDSPEQPLGEGGERLFEWFFSGDTEFTMPSGTMTLKLSPASAEATADVFRSTGAIVSGRRMFDVANGWGGRHPIDVPVFVVTHNPPGDWDQEGSPFTFVTDGVASAVEQAKKAAGDKIVGVGGANIAQQCLGTRTSRRDLPPDCPGPAGRRRSTVQSPRQRAARPRDHECDRCARRDASYVPRDQGKSSPAEPSPV